MARWTADALGADAADQRPPRPPRGARRRGLRHQHDPGRRRAGDADRLRRPGPVRAALHDRRHDQRRRRVPRRCGRSPSCWASPATWRTSAPTRWLLNYTNPMAMLVRAVSEASDVRVVGPLPLRLLDDRPAGRVPRACRATRSTPTSAGLNHLAFVLRLEHRGRDLYPDLRAFVEAGKVPDDDLVRAELFRRLGYYPTESSEHHAEYNPWFIGKRDAAGDAVERFHVPIGEYLDRVAQQPRGVRRDEAQARRRRAVRDRAERRVRGDDRRSR